MTLALLLQHRLFGCMTVKKLPIGEDPRTVHSTENLQEAQMFLGNLVLALWKKRFVPRRRELKCVFPNIVCMCVSKEGVVSSCLRLVFNIILTSLSFFLLLIFFEV